MLKLIVAVVSWPLLVVGAENTDFVQSEFTYKKKNGQDATGHDAT